MGALVEPLHLAHLADLHGVADQAKGKSEPVAARPLLAVDASASGRGRGA